MGCELGKVVLDSLNDRPNSIEAPSLQRIGYRVVAIGALDCQNYVLGEDGNNPRNLAVICC
jgi:hypothetical protein